MFNKRMLAAMAIALAGVCTAGTARAEFINTHASWNGSSSVFEFGEPNTATYGQTITVGPTDTFLTNFTFYLNTESTADSLFAAYVMEWDAVNNRATGPVLYDSTFMSNPGGNLGFNEISISPNIDLVAGSQYVLFLSATGYFDANGDETAWAEPQSQDLYSGGSFVFINNGDDWNALTTDTWITDWLGEGGDLAFTATLTSSIHEVPVPAGAVLFGIGAVGCAVVARRRKKLAA